MHFLFPRELLFLAPAVGGSTKSTVVIVDCCFCLLNGGGGFNIKGQCKKSKPGSCAVRNPIFNPWCFCTVSNLFVRTYIKLRC